jgi:hypothetical protein
MLVALALAGCPAEKPPPLPVPPKPVVPPDVVVAQLPDLLTVVRLDWVVLLRPQRLAETAWLRPSLARILRDERLELSARTTGIDLRNVPELVLAGYRGESLIQLVRHRVGQGDLERRFRERLTSEEIRSEHGHQLVTLFGKIGTAEHGFVAIGRDVAGFQDGGSRKKGPATIAALYAQGKLERIPRVLGDDALGPIHAALTRSGIPPAEVLFPGPFEGEAARGARGLLASATGVGAVLEPTPRHTMELRVIVAGDFGAGADLERASAILAKAWGDLAAADLGHLLGLDTPVAPPQASASELGLALTVELDADLLFSGLAAATIDNIQDIMREATPEAPPLDDAAEP